MSMIPPNPTRRTVSIDQAPETAVDVVARALVIDTQLPAPRYRAEAIVAALKAAGMLVPGAA